MIIAEGLSKAFETFWAVNGVDLLVEQGQVVALLGPNGAGKTTTIRMLTSILKPTRGKAQVAGYDVVAEPEKVRASVGVLTEQHGLYDRMNADEYLMFFGQLYQMRKMDCSQRIDTLLAEFGLDEFRRRKLGKYSKGMRQKLSLIRTILHDPPVLLLDEPTSAMDPESARIVRETIKKLRQDQRTLILCTHNLSEAEALADQIAIIRKGKIILRGTPRQIKEQLLGSVEYEASITGTFHGIGAHLSNGVKLVGTGEHWLRFEVNDPETNNPVLLRTLLNEGIEVITYQEVSRSLEDAYLTAMNQEEREELNV